MFCSYCGKEVPKDAEYCVECGRRLHVEQPRVNDISNNVPDVDPREADKKHADRLGVTQAILGAVTVLLLSLARLFLLLFVDDGAIVMSAYALAVCFAFVIIGIIRFSKKIGRTRHRTAESIFFSLTLILFVYAFIAFIAVIASQSTI